MSALTAKFMGIDGHKRKTENNGIVEKSQKGTLA